MRGAAVPDRCVVQGTRLRLCRSHQFARRLVFLGRDHQQERRVDERNDPREVTLGIIGQRAVGRREDRQRGRVGEQRIAVRVGLGDRGRSQCSSPAAAIVDDEGLSDLLRHLVEDSPADQIDRAAGRHRYGNADRFARPCQRLCLTQRGMCTRHQQQSCEERAPHTSALFEVVKLAGTARSQCVFGARGVKLGGERYWQEPGRCRRSTVPSWPGWRTNALARAALARDNPLARVLRRIGGRSPAARPFRSRHTHVSPLVMTNLRATASPCRARHAHSPLPEPHYPCCNRAGRPRSTNR